MIKKILVFLMPVILLGLMGVFLLSTKNNQSIINSNNDGEPVRIPYVLSMTKSVEVPDAVEFAGEKIDLTRYDMHERYDREINGFTYLHSTTMLLIKRANRFFPVIEPILKKNGIPDDFKYLCVIESNLDPRIVSSAGAAGLWQFMKNTAPSYGLEVSAEVDERYSVEKATEAACRYFKEAYAKYGSWSSVALSYNAGQGRISGELQKQQADDGLDLWLVEETSRYYYRMLAIKQVFENPYRYGFVITADQLYKPLKFREVIVTESVSDLAAFAKEQGVNYAQLKDCNVWLRDRKLTISAKSQKSYTILIPDQKSMYYKKGENIKVHDHNWVVKD